jgi:hypothetical protein
LDQIFNVYIAHPGLKAGKNFGGNNIVWSHQNYWPNYNTVYIWHELLHSYFEKDDKSHALIELITDEEMRIKLNGGKYPPFVEHSFLNEVKLKNLNLWNEYKTKIYDINLLLSKMFE